MQRMWPLTRPRQLGAPHHSLILGMYLLPITPTAGITSRTQPLEGMLSKSSYEAIITLIPKLGKGTTKK